ncbi:MAG: aminotransferase class III-fold pyridoxal phosphate-dependent enzyme [Candidatus Obscuribacterales bacterium]|nr:aminotransferase class III-fold pyridoxal phosphate-dependent enzyme [Candidatus Obscuribacterales bacterium]
MVTVKATDKNLEYLKLDEAHVNPVLSRSAKIVAEKAKGSYIYDMNGDAYLDFTTGIAVNNVGHCHPKVVEAVQAQVAELMHTSVVTHHKRYIELSKKLAEISPGRLDSVFLANSGAECVEGAVKMARYVTGRPCIINFRGSFHGRTIFTTALTTSKLVYREKYEPLPGSIHTVPFPYVYRSHHRGNPEACVDETMHQIDMLFKQIVHPEQVAAFLVEPVQGEGGYVPAPVSFLKKLRELADKHGILLIVDEVQTGFGRTGKMFCIEHYGVEPDVMLMAKGIAGGMPLSAFITRKEISQKWQPGRHGSTFGGNPVSCAAALATIDVIENEKLVERSAKAGHEMMEHLRKAFANNPQVGEVRGLGMMIGVELNEKDGSPSHDIAEAVANKCFQNKLLVLTCGSHGHVLRLIPPLTASDEEIKKGLDILVNAINDSCK